MIQKLQCIINNNIMVFYEYSTESVGVTNQRTQETKMFSGWDELADMFHCFWNSFTEEVDFETAVNYFKPQIGNLQIG